MFRPQVSFGNRTLTLHYCLPTSELLAREVRKCILCFDGVENQRLNPPSPGNVLRPLCYLQGRLCGCHEDNKQPLYQTNWGRTFIYTLPCFLSCCDGVWMLCWGLNPPSPGNVLRPLCYLLHLVKAIPRDLREVRHGSLGSWGCFTTIIRDYNRREISENVTLYLCIYLFFVGNIYHFQCPRWSPPPGDHPGRASSESGEHCPA